ncbi:hypothetical protein GGR57DRAFT_487531 [Xylariaceae sp. FL1272]|nr:hypothetical protein GGR57DRAFT_487531 [Xylariaceae sp. FL1272]
MLTGQPCDGKINTFTFGGLIEVDHKLHIMTCQHNGINVSSHGAGPSLSVPFAETELAEVVDHPLVFCSGDSDLAPSSLDHADKQSDKIRISELNIPNDRGWKSLNVDGRIIKGREWCLLPVDEKSILPIFIQRPTLNRRKNIFEPRTFYLDMIADPQPGLLAYVSSANCSGMVFSNTSFLFGNGMDRAQEVWAIMMDGNQGSFVSVEARGDPCQIPRH